VAAIVREPAGCPLRLGLRHASKTTTKRTCTLHIKMMLPCCGNPCLNSIAAARACGSGVVGSDVLWLV